MSDMFSTQARAAGGRSRRAAGSPVAGWLGRFWQDRSGSLSYVAVAGALIMMVFGGIGIDMIHAELKRTKIQNTLDRAVLAAAEMDNEADPGFVVNDYFRAMNMSDALVNVDVEQSELFKRVSAQGYTTMPANFLELLGVDTLQAGGRSEAVDMHQETEISLVLDISGSMANNQKMERLRSASALFLDTVMTDDNEGRVSVSLVPYSEHVNAGPQITQHLNVDWQHDFSHCLEFPDAEFDSTVLNTGIQYDQAQHFQWNYSPLNEMTDTVCPRYDYERITPFSMDREALKDQIDALQPRAGTSIFLGMKWGSALLDPSTRMIADAAVDEGRTDPDAAGRPADYTVDSTLKTVVLMTDGQHDRSFRIRDWAYDSEEEIERWAGNNLWHYLLRNVSSWQRSSFYTQKYSAAYGDRLLDSICDAAKAQGIVVWSIGFEVSDHGASVMRNCASSPSHFFRVSGEEIEDAFYSIARQINQLRLTQ